VSKILEQLPAGFSKPIFVEYFLLTEEQETVEQIECQIEAFMENLAGVRALKPHLFIVIGPCIHENHAIKNRNLYDKASQMLRMIEYILA
jgi:hypothetical protein